MSIDVHALIAAFKTRRALVGIVGLGYVGLPLAMTAASAGFRVLGFDVNERRVGQINRGESFLNHVSADQMRKAVECGRFEATADFDRLGEPDAVLICVPTPLTRHREPDLSFVEITASAHREAAAHRATDSSRVHHLSRHHRGGRAADPGADGMKSRGRLFPGLLPGTRRSGKR